LGLGFYHTIVGIGLLPASLIAGVLYAVHPSLPFIFGGMMSLAAVVVIWQGVRDRSANDELRSTN
jgi:hypothetical protein